MPATAAADGGRPSLYCQLHNTYLPPSYVPPSCQESDAGGWAWALINTAFVSATTLVNASVLLSIVFLWLVNRQFHFGKKTHSYDKAPLRPLTKPTKALRRAGKQLQKAAKKISFRTRKGGWDDDHVDAPKRLAAQTKRKSFQSFLEDFDEEDDDDEAIDRSLSSDIRRPESVGGEDDGPSPLETRTKKKRTKDLLRLASKIEVFSYLSPEAIVDILEYVEYVDFKNAGDVVYDTDSLDGSMYVCVEGEVTTTLSIKREAGGSGSNGGTGSYGDFSFVAGPGEAITSMLSILTSLVREYQLQDTLLHSLLPGALPKIIIPQGMDVEAVATANNTRLMRIPARCFVAIHKKFPKDVHNICQTIVARLQRVTIQTLMRFLGLDAGILGVGDRDGAESGGVPTKKPRTTTPKWRSFEQSLLNDHSTATQPSALDQAVVAAASLLGLSAESSHELKVGASIIHAPPGSTILRKGGPPDSIYLILRGSSIQVGLEKNTTNDNGITGASRGQNGEVNKARRSRALSNDSPVLEQAESTNFKPLFRADPGNFVGLFSSFTQDASFITVRNPNEAEGDAMLLKIPSATFENVISKHPRALYHALLDIIDTVGDAGTLCVSPSMFLLDMSLDWMHLEAGMFLTKKETPVDGMFVILNGRLRAQAAKEDTKEEYGRGATVGSIEALAEGCWTQSVYAIRHCEVARIPIRIINMLMEMYPSSGIHFAKVIASQIHRKGLGGSFSSLLPSYGLSLATVAVVPLTQEVDVHEFCCHLKRSMSYLAPTKLLTKDDMKKSVGRDFFKHRNSMLRVKLTRILGDVEESNRLVVYESDYQYTWWTKLCVQQADCVLLLVDSREAPELKRVEELLAWANEAKMQRCELVVVHSLPAQVASSYKEHASDNLNNWNEQRPWITRQHLVRCSFADHVQDFRRMSRRITGQSIGLVLGGGGARGLAHLGVIKALNEAGVPVDLVGGTSQGAFVGALLARSPDDFTLLSQSVKEMADDMSSISNKLRDLTFPLTSFFSGHHFNRGIQRILGNARIQDLVLNFFCVSVDICNSCQVVHTKGLCWKYVRASMGLTGYLPPISENNMLLVDGGYMNVLPADVMADLGAKKIIAVDVALEEKPDFYEYGTELSGLWLLWNSWNPFVQTLKVPSMGDISERLSWVSSESTKQGIIKEKVDLFLKPPVSQFGTLDYEKMDEIVKIGYDYSKPLVEEWAEENVR